ncbi:hypothetical protein E4H12_09510 [Candidatus Thorarchaeota archaeon]|nr:MAG: hypothetical protein E4H12_09510 [Candidatus Thorarchaeota archaeon]
MLQIVKKLDFDFDFATTNLGVGGIVETGDNTNYDVFDGQKWTNQYRLDEQSVGEIAGIELIGPISVGGVRDKLEYVRLRINGKEYPYVNLNELMAPSWSPYEANRSPFFGGQVKVGENYEQLPLGFCHNIGVPMLLGGDPTDAVPKVGPGDTISIEVKSPRAVEGGAAVANQMIVRLSVVECRTTEMFQKLGAHYGWLSGSDINQSFKFRDMEVNGGIEEYDVSKTTTMQEDGTFQLDNWTELYGGLDASKPYIYPLIRYANNAAATTPNSEYTFTKVGNNVLHDWQEMSWNYDRRDAVRINQIGVLSHANHRFTRGFIQGRDENPYSETPAGAQTEYPMPLDRTLPPIVYNGPASLGRGMTVWNTKGHIGMVDNGTAIPAWGAAPTRGSTIAIWGKQYKFY